VKRQIELTADVGALRPFERDEQPGIAVRRRGDGDAGGGLGPTRTAHAERVGPARAAASDPMQATFLGLFDALARGDVIPPDWTATLGVQPSSREDWVERAFARSVARY
jgi:hypothetical protein